MFPDNVGEEYNEPWSNRKRVVPIRTYSGRIVHDRRKHYFTVKDVSRIMAKVNPPEDIPDSSSWLQTFLRALRDATIAMLERLLFWLDTRTVESIYEFCIDLLDVIFKVEENAEARRRRAIRMMVDAANRGNVDFKIF